MSFVLPIGCWVVWFPLFGLRLCLDVLRGVLRCAMWSFVRSLRVLVVYVITLVCILVVVGLFGWCARFVCFID